ncbi:MAG: hypothetical protein ACK55Z_29430, partial [bacterium]
SKADLSILQFYFYLKVKNVILKISNSLFPKYRADLIYAVVEKLFKDSKRKSWAFVYKILSCFKETFGYIKALINEKTYDSYN